MARRKHTTDPFKAIRDGNTMLRDRLAGPLGSDEAFRQFVEETRRSTALAERLSASLHDGTGDSISELLGASHLDEVGLLALLIAERKRMRSDNASRAGKGNAVRPNQHKDECRRLWLAWRVSNPGQYAGNRAFARAVAQTVHHSPGTIRNWCAEFEREVEGVMTTPLS
ncbi:hypothetical protein AB4Y42_10795 [Paraburkholderia sp. EG286B]|uniref:hypothetical protein n=1 Tax=Paraburkholderia sp. EG286B TaxID=3237011 RepID=UPI0034D32F55